VLPESWTPSWQLRAAGALRSAATVGGTCAVLWFFFPHVLLVPGTVLSGLLNLPQWLTPARVRLDRARGELAITFGWWTRHVPLNRIKGVDEVFRFGAVIATRDGWTYQISPFRKRRRLERWLRMRTGFEGMDLTITQAAAAARAENPGRPADGASSPARVLDACLLCVMGAAGVVLAALVRPQAGGWLLCAGADLLTAWWGIAGAVVGLLGMWLLGRAVTRAVSARRSRLGPGFR
jgi:hypothetical protein